MGRKKLTKADKIIEAAKKEILGNSTKLADKKKYFYQLPIKEQYEQIKDSKKTHLADGAIEDDFEQRLKEKLFENEIKSKLKEIEDSEESEYFENSKSLPDSNGRSGIWDFSKDDEIKFFDPECSYELTGYRPISKTEGLDFDPAPFCATGRTYTETGSYTEYPKGSKPYADFWKEELRRCTEGYTVGKYRVTGDHYFFLNFYRMKVVDDSKKAGSGSDESFPKFLVEQYKFFHYYEMCEYLKKDVVALKSRGIGWSEIGACMGVRPFITTRNFRSVYVANSDLFVDGVLDKCWYQLNWLNNNTNGGMKRARMKIDNIKQKRASKVDKEGNEYGRHSEIEGIVADNPRKVRGDRTDRLMFEESGSFKMLRTAWVQGEALVTVAGARKGIRSA